MGLGHDQRTGIDPPLHRDDRRLPPRRRRPVAGRQAQGYEERRTDAGRGAGTARQCADLDDLAVIPAKAGIPTGSAVPFLHEIPALAGMTYASLDRTARIEAHVEIVVHRRSEEHTSELQSLMRISYAVF